MIARRVLALASILAWPVTAGASSDIYMPPDFVIVGNGGARLVAVLDQENDRWLSLCREDSRGALDYDVRGLARFGALFDSSLRSSFSAGFFFDETKPPIPIEGGLSEFPMRSSSVRSLQFLTARDRGDDQGTVDYWQVTLLLDSTDGDAAPRVRGEAEPATRDGAILPDETSELFEIDYIWRDGGRCALPKLKRR
jgi:hypothetical protein